MTISNVNLPYDISNYQKLNQSVYYSNLLTLDMDNFSCIILKYRFCNS